MVCRNEMRLVEVFCAGSILGQYTDIYLDYEEKFLLFMLIRFVI